MNDPKVPALSSIIKMTGCLLFFSVACVHAKSADILIWKHYPRHTLFSVMSMEGPFEVFLRRLQPLALQEGVLLNLVIDRRDDDLDPDETICDGETLGQLLDRLVRMNPRFGWTQKGRTVTFFSKKMLRDKGLILNLPLDDLSLKGKDRRRVVSAIQDRADGKFPGKYRVLGEDGEKDDALECVCTSVKFKSAELVPLDLITKGMTGFDVLGQVSEKDSVYWTATLMDQITYVEFSKDGF